VTDHERVVIRFDERWFGRDLVLPAEAVRVDKTGVDLAFEELPRADRAAINRLVIAEERKQRRLSA
jgi:hypothetical protein